MNSNEKIINIIKARRKQLKLSLSETARRMGIPKSTLSRYESLERQFPLNQVSNIAAVLDIPIDDILGLENGTTIKNDIDSAFKNLNSSNKDLLLKLSKLDLDNTIIDTAELMSKADKAFRDKVFSYADYEYFKYLKELEEKNGDNRNTAS